MTRDSREQRGDGRALHGPAAPRPANAGPPPATADRTASGPTGRPGARAATLAVVLLGYLMLPMGMSGTTVAVPRIVEKHSRLHPSSW